jgi:hypothetical protein
VLAWPASAERSFLPLFGSGADSGGQWLEAIADLEVIRAAVQEAALQPAGSPPRWRAVRSRALGAPAMRPG